MFELYDLQMRLRAWLLWPFVAVPVSILVHEMGHWVASKWFGFSNVVLHYSSTSDAGDDAFDKCLEQADLVCASAVHPLRQMAVVSGAGPAVSYLLIVGCVIAILALGARALLVSLAVAAGSRFVLGPVLLFKAVFGQHRPAQNDENIVAWLTGLSPVVPALLGCLVLAAVAWTLSQVPRPRGLTAAVLGGGTIASMLLYFTVVGPWFLP